MESQLGCRYSVLLKLPYFNPINMLVIDPMHNLFLGTAKHMLKLWLKKDLIKKADFDSLQNTVDSIVVPSEVGRVPHKIKTGFSAFTADQFKNWVTLYSIPALHGYLPKEHLECWRHFVLACRILCQHSVSNDGLQLAHALLIQFCKRVEILYGEQAVTPNMHMHGHIVDVLRDFGPVQEFWLFSFERYNGLLSRQPKSAHMIEPQLMKRFLYDSFADSFHFPSEFEEDLLSVCQFKDKCDRGSLKQCNSLQSNGTYQLPNKSTRCILDDGDQQFISEIYEKQHPGIKVISINSIFLKYRSMVICGKLYNANHKTVPIVKWDAELYLEEPTILDRSLQTQPYYWNRPIKVHFFSKFSLTCKTPNSSSPVQDTIVLAKASWYYPHSMRFAYGNPVQAWCSDLFEPHGLHSYIPLTLFISRCAHCVRNVNSEALLIIVPLME